MEPINKPRQTIHNFLDNYNRFLKKLPKDIKQVEQDDQLAQDLFVKIDKLFSLYCQFLREIYKKRNVEIRYPRELLNYAKTHHLMHDTATWIKLIDMCHALAFETVIGIEGPTHAQIVLEYYNKIPNLLQYINDLYLKRNPLKKSKNFIVDSVLPDQVKEINPNDFGIKSIYFDTILQNIQNIKQIKRVWLYGSRTKYTNKECSDIDLIIDIPRQYYKLAKDTFTSIEIPLPIDICPIYHITELYDVQTAILIYKQGTTQTDYVTS